MVLVPPVSGGGAAAARRSRSFAVGETRARSTTFMMVPPRQPSHIPGRHRNRNWGPGASIVVRLFFMSELLGCRPVVHARRVGDYTPACRRVMTSAEGLTTSGPR